MLPHYLYENLLMEMLRNTYGQNDIPQQDLFDFKGQSLRIFLTDSLWNRMEKARKMQISPQDILYGLCKIIA